MLSSIFVLVFSLVSPLIVYWLKCLTQFSFCHARLIRSASPFCDLITKVGKYRLIFSTNGFSLYKLCNCVTVGYSVARSCNHCCCGNITIRSVFYCCSDVAVCRKKSLCCHVNTTMCPFALLSSCKIFRTAVNDVLVNITNTCLYMGRAVA